MKKIFTYCSLLILTGCLSTGGNDISRNDEINQRSNKNKNENNKNNNSGNRSDERVLSSLSKVSVISNFISEKNKSLTKKAINIYNSAQTSKDKRISENEIPNILKKYQTISQSDRNTRLSVITSLIDAYDTGKVTDATLGSYKSNEDDLNKYNNYFLSKKRDDFDTDEKYAEWLSTNAKIANNIKLASFTGDTKYTDYIEKVEQYYFDTIKRNTGIGTDSETYTERRNALQTKINEKNTNLNTIKSFMITQIKLLDNTFTDNQILSPASYANYYRKEFYILTAIQNINYAANVNLDKTSNSLISVHGGNASTTIKYVYSDILDDYILSLQKDTNKISFKASDFKESTSSYLASINDEKITQNNYFTFMPEIKNFIYSGGTLDAEISARKEHISKLIKKVQDKTATNSEKTEFTTLTGITIPDAEFSKEDMDKINTILNVLKDKNSNFSVNKKSSISNSVRLGGNATKLTFSDFGIWSRTSRSSYEGNNNIINLNKSLFTETSDYLIVPFYSGIDQFATKYTTLLQDSSSNPIGAGEKIIFDGNTFATLTKSNNHKDVFGNAKITINNDTGIGNLDLNYDNWYSFRFSDIDFKTDNGFSIPFNISITDSSKAKDFIIEANPSFTTPNADDNNGKMYGLESGKPTEIVGKYTFEANSQTMTSPISVNGVFGVVKK